jgi:HAD superfamily hydrolase (TIGR01509 family)
VSDVELVIFDCDGVLVDSEPLAIGLLAEEARRHGWDLPAAEAERHFPRGGTLERCMLTIERHTGRSLPDDFVTCYRARLYDLLREQVQAVPGVVDALDRLPLPHCVASNGPRQKIRTSLTTIGLIDRFEGRIFTAYELERAKPFPDLYLHAAATLGASPRRCVVVEDSVPGTQAGVAAGMRVLGYAPDPQRRAALADAGAEPLAAMAELLGLLSR